MYEIINRELGIKACGLADLTAEQLSCFLGQWEEGATIGTLTLFFDDKTGDIVLNKDNKLYESYRELTESYIDASADVRKEIREVCPIPGVKETLDVLENCLKSRRIEKEIFRARKNYISSDVSRAVLNGIINKHNLVGAVFIAFRYGVMQGKRMERARRK